MTPPKNETITLEAGAATTTQWQGLQMKMDQLTAERDEAVKKGYLPGHERMIAISDRISLLDKRIELEASYYRNDLFLYAMVFFIIGSITALGMWATGQTTYAAGRLPFILLSACVPVLTAALGFRVSRETRPVLVAGLLSIFSLYYAPFMPVPDNYALFMLLGGAFLLIVPRKEWWVPVALGALGVRCRPGAAAAGAAGGHRG